MTAPKEGNRISHTSETRRAKPINNPGPPANITAPSTHPDGRENLLLLGMGEHLSGATKCGVRFCMENRGGGEEVAECRERRKKVPEILQPADRPYVATAHRRRRWARDIIIIIIILL